MQSQAAFVCSQPSQLSLDFMQNRRTTRYPRRKAFYHTLNHKRRLVRGNYSNADRNSLKRKGSRYSDLKSACLEIGDICVGWKQFYHCRFNIRRLYDFELQPVEFSTFGRLDQMTTNVRSECLPIGPADTQKAPCGNCAIEKELSILHSALRHENRKVIDELV
ncbi:hypothetical protein DEM26_16580 [Thioclava sp. NG1]|nr:hypothetical protein DEM26_16580 [Thioclava sp. NG1]